MRQLFKWTATSRKNYVASILLSLTATTILAADTFFVSGMATPGGDGSEARPFRTISDAAAVLKAGDVCMIAPGAYRETVRPRNSGNRDAPIVFRAQRSGTVVVTGLDVIRANAWAFKENGTWEAPVELSLGLENQVFDGDRMLVLARWPNTGEDLLHPVLATMAEGSSPTEIVDRTLPDYDYTGARTWIHASLYWSNWTTHVTAFERGKLQIHNIAPFEGAVRRHQATPNAGYYVFGFYEALDASNEWYYDEARKTLCLARPADAPPGGDIAVKRRLAAFDLRERSGISVENINILAATVLTDPMSSDITLSRLRILHPYHSEDASSFTSQSREGVVMNGRGVKLEHSEVAYSSGSGVVLDGTDNRVFNCHIHDTDYIGTFASGVQLLGKGNIISHCTITRSGRSVIGYDDMYQALIQYCDLSESGLLTSDLGLTYGNAIEGGNSEVRYNWLHGNRGKHKAHGLYYDHGTQNIITHHNLVTDVPGNGLLINHYAQYHLVYNNTFCGDTGGFRSMWGNKYAPDLYACRFVSNIFGGPVWTCADNYVWINNLLSLPRVSNQVGLGEVPVLSDGSVLPLGTIDVRVECMPHIGAPVSGVAYGHNFEALPSGDFTRSLPPHRNLLVNSAFEHEDHVYPWEIAPRSAGAPEKGKALKIQTTPDTDTVRIGRWSLRLDVPGEVGQVVEELQPDSWYQFAGFLLAAPGETVLLGVDAGKDVPKWLGSAVSGSKTWIRTVVRFKTAKNQTSVRVFAKRVTDGPGNVFVDDCGLVLVEN
jgi:hypothetical protein